MSHLERAAAIVGTILIGTAAYLVVSDRRRSQSRSASRKGEQEHPVEELAEELKHAWAGYHNR
jgi:uncharacterized protein (UPF0297 family)